MWFSIRWAGLKENLDYNPKYSTKPLATRPEYSTFTYGTLGAVAKALTHPSSWFPHSTEWMNWWLLPAVHAHRRCCYLCLSANRRPPASRRLRSWNFYRHRPPSCQICALLDYGGRPEARLSRLLPIGIRSDSQCVSARWFRGGIAGRNPLHLRCACSQLHRCLA